MPTTMRIHLVVNVSQIVRYRKPVVGQRVVILKPAEADREKKWKVEKILNKQKVRGVTKYLVQWKRFTVEHDIWERKKDLGNVREIIADFKGRISTEVRKQQKIEIVEEQDFKRGELPGKYMVRMLYGWNNGKFENKYLRKLKRNWQR